MVTILGMNVLEFGITEFRVFGEVQAALLVNRIGAQAKRGTDQPVHQQCRSESPDKALLCADADELHRNDLRNVSIKSRRYTVISEQLSWFHDNSLRDNTVRQRTNQTCPLPFIDRS